MDLNLGAKIKAEAKRKRISTVRLAQMIPMTRQNLDKIYRKKSVDTELLFLISKALDYDFFKYCSEKFKGKYLAGLDAAMTMGVINQPEENYINPLYDELAECRKKNGSLEEKVKICEHQYKLQSESVSNQQKYIKILEEKLEEHNKSENNKPQYKS